MGTEKLFVKSDINVGGQWTIQNKGDYFDRTGKFGLLSQVFCYIWFLLSSFHCTELYAVVVVFVLVWVCICVFILASWLGDQLHTTSTSQWWSLSCTVAGAERVDRPFARPFRGAVSGVFWASSRSLGPYFCELPVAGPQVLVIYFISCIVSCCFYYCYYLLLYLFFLFFFLLLHILIDYPDLSLLCCTLYCNRWNQ